jgi:hypothetical protein
MTVNLCSLRKLTIGLTGLPNLVITGGASQNWCVRSLENRKRNNERTAYGTPKSLGNKVYKPTFRWLLEDAYVTTSQLPILEFYIATHQATPATVFTVQDEFERMLYAFGAYHSKTIVTDSTVTTTDGLSSSFYACNAWLDLASDKYYESVGEGLVSVKGWSFMEVATN